MSFSQPNPNQVNAAFTNNGTLTNEIDLVGYSIVGLIVTGSMTNGTLGFMVSDLPDVPNRPGGQAGVYRDLKNADGSNVTIGAVSGQFAVSGEALKPLAPYRYVRIKSSVAQPSTVTLVLPLKTHD